MFYTNRATFSKFLFGNTRLMMVEAVAMLESNACVCVCLCVVFDIEKLYKLSLCDRVSFVHNSFF